MYLTRCNHCGKMFKSPLIPVKDSVWPALSEFCGPECVEAASPIVELVPLGNLGNTASVTMLEEWLERARSGEVVALVLVAQTSDRCTATEHCIGEGDLAVLNFALDRMKQRLLDEDGT